MTLHWVDEGALDLNYQSRGGNHTGTPTLHSAEG